MAVKGLEVFVFLEDKEPQRCPHIMPEHETVRSEDGSIMLPINCHTRLH